MPYLSLRRLLPDGFTLALMGTVGLASVLPWSQGKPAGWARCCCR
ncbi:MAG TPA: hypothetical protein VGU65_09790 [Frateuria sp.]|nr:hypothetical protein [Frateuria sp.]